MNRIQAVFFDVGGVLLTNGWDREERSAVLSRFQVDPAAYEDRHEPADDAWERGWMTVEQFLGRTVFFKPRSFTSAEFLDGMRAQSRVLENSAIGVLSKLKKSGQCKLATINNEGRELNDFRIAHFELARYFEAFLSSCYLGLRKPEANIFQVALDVVHVSGNEAAFIDDREENCAAAASLGIHAIQYQGPEQLSDALSGLGVSLADSV